MNANEIITEAAGYVELTDGEALYYVPQSDSVVMGRDGCQPSNSLCLRVGPDHTSNLDWAAIAESVSAFTADRNTANAKPEPTATAKLVTVMQGPSGSARATGYLLGHITAENLIEELGRARAGLARKEVEGKVSPREAAMMWAYATTCTGLLSTIAGMDAAARDAERAEALADMGRISPELRAEAVTAALNYTKIKHLMRALTFTPIAVNCGIGYAQETWTLADLRELAEKMATLLTVDGLELGPEGRASAQKDVDALNAALALVEAQTEEERAKERALWREAINAAPTPRFPSNVTIIKL